MPKSMTVTQTFEPSLRIPPATWDTLQGVEGMLGWIEEHDAWTLSVTPEGTTSMVMLSDDEQTAWYVLTIPLGGVQVDTFTLTDAA